jgi:hypothetical protein
MPSVKNACSTWAEWEAKLEARQKMLAQLEKPFELKKNKHGITFIDWMKFSKFFGTKNLDIISSAAEAWDAGDDPKDYIGCLDNKFLFGTDRDGNAI